MSRIETIDRYLETVPEASRVPLERIRAILNAVAPDAVEAVKYGMPTAVLNGASIIYYAAWKRHIGLYPIYRGTPEFEAAIADFRDKKDTVRFLLSRPIPYDLIERIILAQCARLATSPTGT